MIPWIKFAFSSEISLTRNFIIGTIIVEVCLEENVPVDIQKMKLIQRKTGNQYLNFLLFISIWICQLLCYDSVFSRRILPGISRVNTSMRWLNCWVSSVNLVFCWSKSSICSECCSARAKRCPFALVKSSRCCASASAWTLSLSACRVCASRKVPSNDHHGNEWWKSWWFPWRIYRRISSAAAFLHLDQREIPLYPILKTRNVDCGLY